MSLKLEIGNSTCKFTGLTNQQLSELKAILSYDADPQASYFSGNHRYKRYLIDKNGNFPTGLLYLVEEFYQLIKGVTVIDKRVEPAPYYPFVLKLDLTPYPEQIEAARACKREKRGIVVAPTGMGKSVICALLIASLGVRTLVVVPTLELKRQLTESLTAIFGAPTGMITVENVAALDPDEPCIYDCVIIDEFHHSGAATYRKLNKKAWASVYYKFGLTATAFRSNDNERLLLESVLSKVIYQVPYATAVAKKYIVPIEAYYIELPTKSGINGYSYGEVYSELVVNNTERNDIIAKLLINCALRKSSTLCLVREIAHGEAINKAMIKQAGCQVPFVKGENDDNKEVIAAFNNQSKSVLIGTVGVLGEGVDTKPAEVVVIAGLGKSKNQLMQQVGRGLRVFGHKQAATIILFKDKSHKYTLRHFNMQAKILREEYGVRLVKLEI